MLICLPVTTRAAQLDTTQTIQTILVCVFLCHVKNLCIVGASEVNPHLFVVVLFLFLSLYSPAKSISESLSLLLYGVSAAFCPETRAHSIVAEKPMYYIMCQLANVSLIKHFFIVLFQVPPLLVCLTA